jgi:type IV secretion system protein VirB1
MKRTAFVFAFLMMLPVASLCQAQVEDAEQQNAPVTLEAFRQIGAACAPGIPLVTLRAIARAESAFHPYALSLNYPRRTASEHGLGTGGITLARQPRTRGEALAWTRYLLKRGRSVSVGLMQINTEHAANLRLTVDQLFDPCTNVRVGARLLTARYQAAAAIEGEGQQALQQALSEYNSGSAVIGVANGYVTNVINGELYRRQPSQ